MSEGSADTARRTVTPHIVVRDAAAASEWYQRALGAEERGRIPVPGGRFMQIELCFGDSTVMIADEFPELDVLSPLSVGGTVGALAIHTDDVDMLWRRALAAGAKVSVPCRRCSGATATGRSSTRSATDGGSPNTSATSRPRRSGRRQRRSSEVTRPDPGQGGSHQRRSVMARFGMVGKLVAQPGQGQELLKLLIAATRSCRARIIAERDGEAEPVGAHRAGLVPAVVRDFAGQGGVGRQEPGGSGSFVHHGIE